MDTALRSLGLLDVLSSTPAGPLSRWQRRPDAPCIHARLRRLATKLCERCGLKTAELGAFAKPDCCIQGALLGLPLFPATMPPKGVLMLAEFINEPVLDFSQEPNRKKQLEALALVQSHWVANTT